MYIEHEHVKRTVAIDFNHSSDPVLRQTTVEAVGPGEMIVNRASITTKDLPAGAKYRLRCVAEVHGFIDIQFECQESQKQDEVVDDITFLLKKLDGLCPLICYGIEGENLTVNTLYDMLALTKSTILEAQGAANE